MTITDQKEIRVIRKPLELRAVKGDDGGDVFEGYVFAWDTESDDLGGFTEVIRKGACGAALKQPKNLFAILDHDKAVQKVLGDRDGGTLDLFEDDRGFGFRIKAPQTTAARDAAAVANHSKIGVSFAFRCGKQNWTTRPDGSRLREITEFAEFDDISLVVDAAYKSSDVTVAKRSLEEAIAAEERAHEKELEYRGALPYKAGPTDDQATWDGDAAEGRVRKWATTGSGDDAKVDYAKYQQAFAYKTGDGTKLEDFHLQHHDVKDGKLVVVWGGVAAAMKAVCGARGGVKWEKESDREPTYNHLKKHYKQFDKEAPELRSLKEIEAMEAAEKRPAVDYLRRTLDLIELEYRLGANCVAVRGEDAPDHAADRREAHWATERALEAKRSTGAPSRALELQAAAANKKAAGSATAEGKDAAAEFHKAAAKMHDAAASDEYAEDFQTGMNYRSLETRSNDRHDEDGKFHDGSPESILNASRGKLSKAEARHAAAAKAYREAVLAGQDNPDNIDTAKQAWCEARGAHQDAITAADAAVADVTALHEQRMKEHRDMILDHKAKWAMPEYANPAADVTNNPAAATSAEVAASHASDAPVE
jgi:HK97 family phage prohead protease